MRLPAVAGRFYPSDADSLRLSIEACFDNPLASGRPSHPTGKREIRGMMVPHAGYMASGPNAANSFRLIAEDGHPDAYVVIGPDHHGMCPVNTLCSDDFLTPFGRCRVHEDICSRLSRRIPDIPEAHRYEHSVEVEVPFIQYIDPDARIVPIMMSDQSPEAAIGLARDLEDACRGYDVVFIASTDLSHYIPKEEAERLDSMILDRVRGMDWKGLYRLAETEDITMCGYGPTAAVMMLCKGCIATDVKRTDSYECLGISRESVVGYASAVFRHE